MIDVWWANMKCPTCGHTVRDIELPTYQEAKFGHEYRLIYPEPVWLHPCRHRMPIEKVINVTFDRNTGIPTRIEMAM